MNGKKGITLICFLLAVVVVGQNHYELHAKYWRYRSRLRNDFMLVGTGQGMSIPLEQRGAYYAPYLSSTAPYYTFNSNPNGTDGQTAKWGDAMGELGYYIGVLATEYELLRSNGQDVSQTVYEAYCALYALNRMDWNAENLWTLVYNNNNPSSPGNWPPALNGFMVRDDVDLDFVLNNYQHFNYFGNRGFISNIKINNSMNISNGGQQTCWSTAMYNTGPAYHGTFISQDNYYNVLVGLTLLRKYMDPNQVYTDAQGIVQSFHDGKTKLWEEAYAIANRVHQYFQNTSGGFIKYPDGSNIATANGGFVDAYAFAHSEAVGRMHANNYSNPYFNPTEGWAAFHDKCDRYNYTHTNSAALNAWRIAISIPARWTVYQAVPHNISGLPQTGLFQEAFWQTIADGLSGTNDKAVMTTNLTAICNCRYNFNGNITGDKMKGPEYSTDPFGNVRNIFHGQLLRVALNGYKSCSEGEPNPFPSSDFNQVGPMLEFADCYGTWSYSPGYGPSYSASQDQNFEWHTTSRLDWPDRRKELNHTFFPGEYNGLDYMLYHNLYYLVNRYANPGSKFNKLVDFTTRHLALNYPVSSPNTNASSPWGSAANPAFVGAYEFLSASNTMNNGAVVSLRAGKEIQFKVGFSSEPGSEMGAWIEQLDCSSIFNEPGFSNINARQTVAPEDVFDCVSMPTSMDSAGLTNYMAVQQQFKSSMPVAERSRKAESLLQLPEEPVINLYPNPNDGQFFISIINPGLISSIDIMDVLGETVNTPRLTTYKMFEIDLTRLKAGVYFVVAKTRNNKIIVKKVIKN